MGGFNLRDGWVIRVVKVQSVSDSEYLTQDVLSYVTVGFGVPSPSLVSCPVAALY